MALTIGDNFKYQANKPNFERDSFATLEAMKAYPETSIDDGHLSYCAETNKHYKFLSSNTVDETTGKWREFETTVGNSFPSDGVEGQYLKKSDTGVKWDDGDVFYLNPRDFARGSVTQDTYNKLVNVITNNKIIYIVSNFNGDNQSWPSISTFYNENTGITIDTLMDDTILTVHINPDLTVEQEEKINFNLGGYVKYDWFVLKTFNISGDDVTYSPTVISNNDANIFRNAYNDHQRLQLLLGSGSDDWVDLFPTQFNSVSPTYPGAKYSFIGITKYNDKCYTILLSLAGLSSANDRDWQLDIKVIPHFYIENSTFRNNQFIKRKEDNTYEWSTIEYPRIVLSEFSVKKFFGEYSMVVGADSIGWAGALLVDDFSSDKYRDFYCCMTYGQGIVIRHTYATDTYEYLNSFIADFSTTSSSYTQTNKMNSGGWGKVYEGSALPLAYISRCSPDSNYIHTYYAYQIDTSVTPYNFVKKLTIKYGGSKLAAITSDITVDAEKKHLYIHGYKTGSIDAIRGTSLVMVFNLPEPGGRDTITLTDNNIVWEFEFFVDEAAQDLYVSGGRLYYPYGGSNHHGLAVIDTSNGAILQNIDLTNISTNFINSPEPEGVYVSNGKLYLNYHHSNTNKNEVCLVEFPLQEVKEAVKVPTKVSQLENDANYLIANKDILESVYMYGIEFDTTVADPACTRIGNPELHRTLPIQSKMRGCLLNDDGVVVKYLNPDTWVDEVIDGSMGQVMVEIPEFYIKFEEDGTKRKVKMSLVPIVGYLKVSKAYISAYEATVQRSTNKLSSVCNKDADYRGGNNDSSRDGTYRTMLGMPATSISLNTFHIYARNRGSVEWNCNLYHLQKMLWWLFAVEYANFNSQATFNAALDENGYRRGGLGAGVTTWDWGIWTSYNGNNPIIPCGVSNSLGNHTGTVDCNVIGSDGTTLKTFAVPRYRGIENPFGHIWKWTDGCKCIIQSEASGALSKFYVCDDPAKFTASGVGNYDYRGNLPRSEGYVKVLILGEDGEIMPLEVGGGSTTYFCDYFYTSIPSSGEAERGVLFGGHANVGAIAGFVCATSDRTPAYANANVGSRLCFIPNYN